MENKKLKFEVMFGIFIILEVTLFFLLFSFFTPYVLGGVGENVTVITYLEVANVPPEILNVTINEEADSVTLVANDTVAVYCTALVRDYNNDTDLANATAEFFDVGNSNYGASDDNNDHYTNSTCEIQRSYTGTYFGVADDDYYAIVNCTFDVYYYANPGEWNCTIFLNDTTSLNDTGSDNVTVSELLAIGLPPDLSYGSVNATEVSLENITNVTNFGNVALNLSLYGYGSNETDGLAMNCTLGSIKNISIEHEKYNLTTSTPGVLTLGETSGTYINLTNSAVVKKFDLGYRNNDTFNEAVNETYWRIYVPLGVAGSCQGNIVFGATKSDGT